MDAVSQIFGAALDSATRGATAPQGVEAIVSPAPMVDQLSTPAATGLNNDGSAEQPVPMVRLAQKVLDAMRRNVAFRDSSGVSKKLQYALDAYTNRFDDQQLAALSTVVPPQIASRMFTPLTFTKIRAAKALFVDVVHSISEPLFDVSPSPYPEVAEEVDEQILASMIQDINTIFSTLEKTRGGQPLSEEEMQMLMSAVQSAPAARKDEFYARRMEYATVRARRMQEKIWDIFVEGGGDKAFSECISNACLYGTCFLVGPIPRVVAENKVHRDKKNGIRKFVRNFKLKPVFESLNPIDCYPAPDAKQPSDGPFCIREKYTAETLWRFSNGGATRDKNGEGWNEVVVRELLDRHPNGGVKLFSEPEDERKRQAEQNSGAFVEDSCTFEAVRCFLSVRGSELAEIGIVRNRDNKKIVVGDYYHAEVIVIDGKVVYCRILDARLDVPISKAVFYDLPGSFWGESIADKLEFVQMMQNNTAKALFLDLGATGPMIAVHQAHRLLDKSPEALKWRPYGFLRFGDEMYAPSGANGAPVSVLDIPTKASQLIAEWQTWQEQADTDSGIPRFAEGGTSGTIGALRTSGGLAQMTEHMMRSVKMIATQFDDGIIKSMAQRTADWILAYDDDMDLKGDVYIRPVGMIGRILKAQMDQARLQFFNVVAANPFLQQVFGPKGIVAMARSVAQNLNYKPEEVLPSEEHVNWLEDVNKLATISAAEQQAAGNQPQAEGASGVSSGVEPPPSVPSGVEERRSVA